MSNDSDARQGTSFGIRIPPCRPVSEVADAVVAAEDAGFAVAWIPDSQFLWRDVWAALALAAERTSRIRLGTCVTNFETRHPAVTAAAAATVAELAPGRMVLGVGSGDSAVKTIGRPPTRLAQMRRHLEQVRDLLAGDAVAYDGRRMRLHTVPAGRIPLYLAANGPNSLALAGELCDGVLTLTGITQAPVREIFDRLAAGAARAGRPVDDIDVCVGAHCQVSPAGRADHRLTKPLIVASAQTGAGAALSKTGIRADPPAVVGGIYPDAGHAEDWAAAVDACDMWVSDADARAYADQFCAIGTPQECLRQLTAAISAGARSFYLRHFGSYTLPHELIRDFAPLLAQLAPARAGTR